MNYLVIGLGRSGISACNLLVKKEFKVFAYDDNKKIGEELKCAKILNEKVELVFSLSKKLAKVVDCIVLSPGVPFKKIERFSKKNNIEVISEIELASMFCPCEIVAVTGTNGKTTTVNLLNQILKTEKQTFLVGNIGTPFCDEVQNMGENDIAICEVSSFQLEHIKNFKPKIAVILNLAPDHMDRYENFQQYAHAKFNLFKNMTKQDVAVLNFDDLLIRALSKSILPEIFYFSKYKQENFNGIFQSDNNFLITIKNNIKEVFDFDLSKHKGLFSQDVMCAILIANFLGISKENIIKSLENFSLPKHRIEFVDTIGKVSFYDDSKATNIHSCLSALGHFSESLVLILGGSDKKEDFSTLFKPLPKNVIKIVAYGKTAKKIYKKGVKSGYKNIVKTKCLQDAFDEAVKDCHAEAILLSPACASFDEFNNYEERGEFFKNLVKDLKK